MEAVIISLMLWLHNTTTFVVPADPPQYEYITLNELSKKAKSKKTSRSDSVIAQPKALCIDEKLYFLPEIDLNNLKDRSIILHELVHYMQNKCHTDSDFEFFEMQAYAVQSYWLKQNGIDITFKEQGSHGEDIIPLKPTTPFTVHIQCYGSCQTKED